MNKLVKYELKEIPRSTTRGQWRVISRWLRKAENHMTPIIVTVMDNLIGFGDYPEEIRDELSLHMKWDKHQPDSFSRVRQLQADIVKYFYPSEILA